MFSGPDPPRPRQIWCNHTPRARRPWDSPSGRGVGTATLVPLHHLRSRGRSRATRCSRRRCGRRRYRGSRSAPPISGARAGETPGPFGPPRGTCHPRDGDRPSEARILAVTTPGQTRTRADTRTKWSHNTGTSGRLPPPGGRRSWARPTRRAPERGEQRNGGPAGTCAN